MHSVHMETPSRTEKTTVRIPLADANWRAPARRLSPVVMPVALDLKFSRAVTQPMPLFGGDEVR